MKFRKFTKKLYDSLIGRFELWQQMLNIAVIIAIVGAGASVIISMILGNSVIAILAFLLCALLGVICLLVSLRLKDITIAAVLYSVVSNFVLFPVMFFTSGGYHGGMPLWLLLGLVITWIVIKKKILYVIYVLSLIFQCGCILYSEAHPETVVQFDSERTIAFDVVQSLILVSLILALIIKYMGYAYEKKKKELDEANALLAKMNERITLQAMYTLAKTIDAKDKYTNGHSMRVAKYSSMLARKMGFDEVKVEEIYNMALLHDIGKIGVPDEIINKTSSLTDEEFYVMKKHPKTGYDILSEMSEIKDLGIGARWHHERYDGKGYPDGLKGEEIPLQARIICVADAYDAMTSNRSYRSSMSQDKVKTEIIEGRGTQFDPGIADVMLEIIDEDKEFELHG